MTEKTFYSATTGRERSLIISGTGEGNVYVTIEADVSRGIQLDPATIPAIMLALAEAAAVPIQGEFSGRRKGTAGHLSFIAKELELYVVENAHIEAEAEARAKLEAEAVELENAGRDAAGADRIEELSEMGRAGREFILAVARKAREIRAEK